LKKTSKGEASEEEGAKQAQVKWKKLDRLEWVDCEIKKDPL